MRVCHGEDTVTGIYVVCVVCLLNVLVSIYMNRKAKEL